MTTSAELSPGAVSSGRLLVTGASGGIGRTLVTALVDRGASVVAVGRDMDALLTLAKRAPSSVTVVVGDLADPAQRRELVPRAVEVLGGLDGLVNCAGRVDYQRVGAITQAALEVQLAVNLVAPILLAQEAAEVMRAGGGGGAIVNVASTLADAPAPATTAYAATKAGLLAATRGLAHELAADCIRVNAVSPGVVDTPMVREPRLDPGETLPDGETRDAAIAAHLEELRRLHPLGRLGTPEDVTGAVLYVLDATWMTGSVLTLDGGLLLR